MDLCVSPSKGTLEGKLPGKKSDQDIILSEVGQRVDIAETKFEALRAQLDYTKTLYNAQNLKKRTEGTPSLRDHLNSRNDSYSKLPLYSDTAKRTIVISPRSAHIQQKSEEKSFGNKFQQRAVLPQGRGPSENSSGDVPMSVTVRNIFQSNKTRMTTLKDLTELGEQNSSELLLGSTKNSQENSIDSKESSSNKIHTCAEENDQKTNETEAKDAFVEKSAENITRKPKAKPEKKQKSIYSTLTKMKPQMPNLSEMVGARFKRKRGRVRSSLSKTSVTTKDTCFTGRQETKRKKPQLQQQQQKQQQQKVEPQKPQQQQQQQQQCIPAAPLASNNNSPLPAEPASQPKKWSDGIEDIYHNKAAVRSASVSLVCSKHSKIYSQAKNFNNELASHSNPIKKLTNRGRVSERHERNESVCNTSIFAEMNNETARTEMTRKLEVGQPEEGKKLDDGVELLKAPDESFGNQRFDPLIVHNYQMPTLASKLKIARRSYFHEFSFRNIPFVVGTSVSPSHNLGLNIQQVLNIIKTRHPMVGGSTPLLIRKVSRGMKPVTALLEIQNEHFTVNKDFPLSNMNSRQMNMPYSGFHKQYENTFSSFMRPAMMNPVLNKTDLLTEKPSVIPEIDSQDEGPDNIQALPKIQTDRPFTKNNMKFSNKGAKASARISSTTIDPGIFTHAEETMSVNSLAQNPSMKGIKSVFVKLHDEFKEMNTKYDKLKAETKTNSNNKQLSKQLAELEVEINAKEEEINAFINLYKEVMTLKHQMKLLQQRNSFVCVGADYPMSKHCCRMPYCHGRACYEGQMDIWQHYKRNVISNVRQPPTSFRLAGLLRQIQSYQKQLKHET